MKKNFFLSLFLLGMFFGLHFVSCREPNYIRHTEVAFLEPNYGIITTPMIMEIEDVSNEKVTDTLVFNLSPSPSKYNNNSGDHHRKTKNIQEGNWNEYRQASLDYCVEKHKCDIIVCPRFQFSLSSDQRSLTVIISGFPAKYSVIRPATINDGWMLNFMGQGEFNDNIIHYSFDTIQKR